MVSSSPYEREALFAASNRPNSSMNTTTIPELTQTLVIGGGPAGSYAAAVLAREGIDVVLLEAAVFPRYHIGESMLPSIRHFLRFIDAEEKVINHKFMVKPGAAMKFNQFKREGYTDFVASGSEHGSWNVIRSELDEILLRHAAESGAKVFEGQSVTEIEFDDSGRPTHASCKSKSGIVQRIAFDYLVDASGRNGIMSTKYLRNREMNSSLKNIACWGYWTGAGVYMPGTSRQNAPWFEALTDQSGWGWFIPLHNGTVSIGIVMDISISNEKKAAGRKQDKQYSLKQHYLDQFEYVPGLKKLLQEATLRETHGTIPTVQSASDFSYSAKNYSGDHYRIVGDAAAFIDPFFSSGVHLAFTGGLSAAASICASIRGQCSEQEATKFHNSQVGSSYTRFLLVVVGAYKQMRAQNMPILSDVNEDNFDRAFDLIRPVIQGTADVDKKLSQVELEKTMDFVTHAIATPVDPEMYNSVKARLSEELLSPNGKVLLEEEIQQAVGTDDEEALHVLRKANARKLISAMYHGPINLAAENIDGMYINAKRGELGLEVVGAGIAAA